MKNFVVLFVVLFCFVGFFGVAEAQSEEDTPPLFYLIAGSFVEKDNAVTQQEKLYKHRYYSHLMGYPIDGVLYWRVVVSQDEDKERLEEMKSLLGEDGFETFIAYDAPGEEKPIDEFTPVPVPKPEKEETIENLIKERFTSLDSFFNWLRFALENY